MKVKTFYFLFWGFKIKYLKSAFKIKFLNKFQSFKKEMSNNQGAIDKDQKYDRQLRFFVFGFYDNEKF